MTKISKVLTFKVKGYIELNSLNWLDEGLGEDFSEIHQTVHKDQVI